MTTEESGSCCEVRDECEAIDLFIPPPCTAVVLVVRALVEY